MPASARERPALPVFEEGQREGCGRAVGWQRLDMDVSRGQPRRLGADGRAEGSGALEDTGTHTLTALGHGHCGTKEVTLKPCLMGFTPNAP